MAPVALTHLAHVPAFVPPKARLPNSTRPADCEGLPELDGAVAACNELPRRNPVAVLDAAHVKSECIKAAEATLPPTELDEVRRTWRSNGRLLSWAHMAVAKGTIIKLHCHPNVEVIYVISGALSEDRLKRTEAPDGGRFLEGCAAVLDADLSQTTKDDFETRTHRAGAAFANEIGSVHRSYTDEGCELLVLWGGCHAPVAKPPPFMIGGVREYEPVEAFRRDCSDWIMNALADAGCTNVYGGHGGALVPLVNAVCANPRLNWVCVRNEANASLMAAAEAKLTGRLACCIATSGPGATNLTTGLVEAVQDRLPVVCLTGLKPRQSLHFAEFQDVDQSRLFAGGGVSFSVDVASPESLIPLLRDAVSTAVTRRTCVHLAIPVDVRACVEIKFNGAFVLNRPCDIHSTGPGRPGAPAVQALLCRRGAGARDAALGPGQRGRGQGRDVGSGVAARRHRAGREGGALRRGLVRAAGPTGPRADPVSTGREGLS